MQNTRNSNCCLRNSNTFYWHSYCCHIVQSFAPPLLWPKHFSLFAFFLQAEQEPKQIWRQIPKRLQDWKEKLIKDVVRFTRGGIILAKGRLATTNHDSAPRPQRFLFANPKLLLYIPTKMNDFEYFSSFSMVFTWSLQSRDAVIHALIKLYNLATYIFYFYFYPYILSNPLSA